MLKFGIFSRATQKLIPYKPNQYRSELNLDDDDEEHKKFTHHNRDLEALITYLAYILEYEEDYFRELGTEFVKRSYVEHQVAKKNLFMDLGKGIGNVGLSAFKNLTGVFMKKENEDDEEEGSRRRREDEGSEEQMFPFLNS